MPLNPSIKKLSPAEKLSEADAYAAIQAIFSGAVPDADIKQFLLALNQTGIDADALTGAARAMRDAVVGIRAPANAVDVCGTGGDGKHTLNVSTAAAFVVAACGIPVAKHGGRAVSSKAGSADVLKELGVAIDLTARQCEMALAKTGICFLYAPQHHPAMAKVAPIRRELGVRTIFNLLGPVTNPALVKHQLVGVYDKTMPAVVAETLKRLGSTRALVVHSRDGLDEISTAAPTDGVLLQSGKLEPIVIEPSKYGITPVGDLAGQDSAYNAAVIMNLFKGERGGFHDIVCLNAAAALWVAGRAADIGEGLRLAKGALATGDTLKTFTAFRDYTLAA